jgi:quercetin dioxygenase-like cupin family protein
LPVAERSSEFGCYFVANAPLGELPDVPLFWHIHAFPTRAAAEAAKGEDGIVVESLGKVWIYAIAEQGWRSEAGERVAVIGPLHVKKGRQYTARYMEATFKPGMHTSAHRHSGPEAWYVVSGAQCLDTTEGVIVARGGDSAVVPEGPGMVLRGIGKETRRALVLILHDSSQPYTTLANDWKPSGRCPKE